MKRIVTIAISTILTTTFLTSCSNQTPILNNYSVNQISVLNKTAEPITPELEAKCLKMLMEIKGEEKNAKFNLNFMKKLYENDKAEISFFMLTMTFANNFNTLKSYLGTSNEVISVLSLIHTTLKSRINSYPILDEKVTYNKLTSIIFGYILLYKIEGLKSKDAKDIYRMLSEFDPTGSQRELLIGFFEKSAKISNPKNPDLLVMTYEKVRNSLSQKENNLEGMHKGFSSFYELLLIETYPSVGIA